MFGDAGRSHVLNLDAAFVVLQRAEVRSAMPEEMLKNIAFAEPVNLLGLIDYAEGRVVSRTLTQKKGINITLFAFEAGEGLSEHTTPGDALVLILDGKAMIRIGATPNVVKVGEAIVMPSNVPHALIAEERFKMLLVVVKKGESD